MNIIRERERQRRIRIYLVVAISLLLTGGMSGGLALSYASFQQNETLVQVTLSDFTNLPDYGWSVNPSHFSAPEGKVIFDVININTGEPDIPHNLVVVRSDLLPDALPRLDDGLGVDESAVQVPGRTTHLFSGEKSTLELELSAGSYVLVCNVNPQGIDFNAHYEDGMFTAFTVTGG